MSHSLHSGLNLVTDWEECHEAAAHLVSGGAPFFLGRVGGSDTDAVVDYLAARNEGTADALQHVTDRHLARVMKFNGFMISTVLRTNFFGTYVCCSNVMNSAPDLRLLAGSF